MIEGLDEQSRTLLRSCVKVPQHVVYRDFPAETVVLNLQTERYHGLNPTAGQMLAALDRPGTVEDAARSIAQRYSRPQQEVESDICGLCERLLERGLIELDEATDA
jgi:Coenzyme PQQ synthesis protein D (PqqD)